MVGERNTLPGRALLAGGLLACGLALAGCGSGGQEALVGLLTRSARPSKEDLLQASRASLAQEGGAALAAAGFRQFLASFADDPRATDVRLDLAEALIAAGQPDRARETLGAVGPTSGVQAARGLYLRGLASLGDASAVHPHVQKGARSMLELHALIDQLATKSRPLPDYQVESMRQRLHIEDSVAQAEVDLSAAANLLATPRAAPELFATIAESEARAFFLLRNRARAVAIVTRALDSLSEARVAPERVKELLLLRAFFFAENRESDRAVLDLNRAVDGAVPAGAKPPQAAGAGGGATGSGPSLTENLQLVFRRATERLAAQTTLRARLARGTLLLTGEGSRGQAQLEALLPELDAAGEAALARAAQFALATRDQVADAAATISRVQALLPALASDPELEAAALITLAQYGFLDIALDQPPARPAADRLAVHQCTVGAIRRALALAKSGGFADPNLDARFLSQYPAPVPATAALPLGPVSFLPGVATSLELAGHAFVALPGRTADESFFAFGSLGNGPLEPPLGFTVGGGRLPSGLGLAASGSLSGTATETGVFSVDVDVSRAGPAEDSQRLELASVAIGLVDPDRRTYPMNPVVRAAAGSFRLTAAGGLPPYRLQIARVDTQLGSVAPRLTTAAISSDARNTFVVPIDNADTFSPSRIRVQLSDGAGHSVKEVLVLTRNAFPAASPTVPAPAIHATRANPLAPFRLAPAVAGQPYEASFAFLANTDAGPAGEVKAVALPPGLAMGSSSTLTGTVPVPGLYAVRLRFADSSGTFRLTRYLELLVEPPSPPTGPFPFQAAGGTFALLRNQPATVTLAALGGTPPLSWSVVSGALPPGLALSTDGVFSGLPTGPSVADFTAQVVDSAGRSAVTTISIRLLDRALVRQLLPGVAPYFVQVADFDGDGRLDVISADCNGSPDFKTENVPCDSATLTLWRGIGGGQLAASGAVQASLLSSLATAPNLRRAPAALLTSLGGTLPRTRVVLLEETNRQDRPGGLRSVGAGPDGRLAVASDLLLPDLLLPERIATGDLDADGNGDLLVSTTDRSLLTYYLQPIQSLADSHSLDEGQPSAIGVAADVNRDGQPDLVIQRRNDFQPDDRDPGISSMSTLVRTGVAFSGTVVFPESDPQPFLDLDTGLPGSIATGAFTRGAGSGFALPSTYLVLPGAPEIRPSPGRLLRDAKFVVSGDFDGDGNLDLAFASGEVFLFALNRDESQPVNRVFAAFGDGAGRFHASSPVAMSASIVGLAVGDLDGDGSQDLLVSTVAGVETLRWKRP